MRFATIALGLFACPTSAFAQELMPVLTPAELISLAKETYRGEACWWDRVEADIDQVRSWDLGFRYEYEMDEDGPERVARLYQMPCSYGAYNLGSIFFFETEFDGLGPLHFAVPELDIDYAGDDDAVVESVTVIGFSTMSTVVNASFDEETRTISSFSKWRGLGDAFSAGTWIFHDGHFMLREFAVDASYDGESTPETVYSAPGG